jgi:hypothetical protein
MRSTETPAGLGERGARFWAAVTEAYELARPDELELLAEGCRLFCLADELREAVEAEGFTTTGSAGQTRREPVAHRAPGHTCRAPHGVPSAEVARPGDGRGRRHTQRPRGSRSPLGDGARVVKVRLRKTVERDFLDHLRERRDIKLLLLPGATPEQERDLARQCRLPVAELRARVEAHRSSGGTS